MKQEATGDEVHHLSYDITREHQLASSAARGVTLARHHIQQIESLFPAVASGDTGRAATFWRNYLEQLAAHLSLTIGKDATTAVLRHAFHLHLEDRATVQNPRAPSPR